MFFSFIQKKSRMKEIRQPNKALVKEGEKPANHTKRPTDKTESKFVIRFPENLNNFCDVEEKIETCIPDRARIWLRRASLKLSETISSVYSFEALSKAKRKPPALFHMARSLLKLILQIALKKDILLFQSKNSIESALKSLSFSSRRTTSQSKIAPLSIHGTPESKYSFLG